MAKDRVHCENDRRILTMSKFEVDSTEERDDQKRHGDVQQQQQNIVNSFRCKLTLSVFVELAGHGSH